MQPGDMIDPHRVWAERYSQADLLADRIAAMPLIPERCVLEGFLAWRTGRLADGLAHLRVVSTAGLSPRWLARAHNTRSVILVDLGLISDAIEANDDEHRCAAASGDRVGLLRARHDHAVIRSQTSPQQSVDEFAAVIADAQAILAEPAPDAITAGERIEVGQIVAIAQVNLSDLARRPDVTAPANTPTCLDAETSAEGWPELSAHIRAERAYRALEAGRRDEARALAETLPDPSSMRDGALAVWVAVVDALLTAEDDPRAAMAALDDFSGRVPLTHQSEIWEQLTNLAERAGDLPAALAYARRHVTAVEQAMGQRSEQVTQALEVWMRTGRAEADAQRLRQQSQELTATLEDLRASHEAIRELTVRDTLTGLHNRLHLWEVGEKIIAQATPAARAQVAMVDLDAFKELNDSRGHSFGDEVLRAVAALLSALTREGDLCVRYGGDEFVVVRPGSVDGSLASDLRVLAEDRGGAGITASVGVVHTAGGSLQEAVDRADQVMYRAKRRGGAFALDLTD